MANFALDLNFTTCSIKGNDIIIRNHRIMSRIVILLTIVLSSPIYAADWMQWRGPNHDGVSPETGLLQSWPEGGPKLLWQSDTLGVGYSNIVFHDGKIFSMGDNKDACYLLALDAKNGDGLWAIKVGKAGGNYEGPRCTPATDGKLVFAIGQFGDFVCADVDGKLFWSVNVAEKYGGKFMSNWNFSMSPIIDENRVVLPIGGNGGTVIAFEKSLEGPKVLWQSKEFTEEAAYTSVVPMTFGGKKQYVVLTAERIAGLDPENGKVLWQAPYPGRTAVCSDPVYVMDGEDTCYIMAACAYNVGAYGYKVTIKDGNFAAEEIYSDQSMQSHHGGIVQLGGLFYLLTQRELVCVDPKTGKTLWKNRSVGKGSVFSVDGKLIARSESGAGTIALIEPSPEGYKEISRFDQPDRTKNNSWTYPVVFEGKLYLRDQHLLFCYELK